MWVSRERIAKARTYDVLSYLQIADPSELVRVSSNEFCLRSHDSFRISNGKWHWWSRDKAGHTAIDYLVEVKGYSFPYAVNEVLKVMDGVTVKSPVVRERVFRLPEASLNNDAAIRYLRERGINDFLVKMLIKKGMIYEDRKYNGVIFVGCDFDDKPKHASYRATDGSTRKGDISGSDKRFCFKLPIRNCKTLRVFEGPVDLISYVTLAIMDGVEWKNDDMISVCGVYKSRPGKVYELPAALLEYMKHNSNVEKIYIHFDNDEVGLSAAQGVIDTLGDRYEVINMPPDDGKDYNEYLNMVLSGGCNGRENND